MLPDCTDHGQRGNLDGYGRYTVGGKRLYAHRVAYARANNVAVESLADKVVRHKCDNPRCVNPAHLLLGTQVDNMADMSERGRHGNLRFTNADVQRMRELYQPRVKGALLKDIGRLFNTNESVVHYLLNHKRATKA